jgi:hypothetical protein
MRFLSVLRTFLSLLLVSGAIAGTYFVFYPTDLNIDSQFIGENGTTLQDGFYDGQVLAYKKGENKNTAKKINVPDLQIKNGKLVDNVTLKPFELPFNSEVQLCLNKTVSNTKNGQDSPDANCLDSGNSWVSDCEPQDYGFAGAKRLKNLLGNPDDLNLKSWCDPKTGVVEFVASPDLVGTIGKKFSDTLLPQSGTQGEKGDKGTTGATGVQGSNGNDGFSGQNGLNGVNGLPGSQGQQGSTGSQGTNGTTGSQGPTGLTGATGAVGATGPTSPLTIVGNVLGNGVNTVNLGSALTLGTTNILNQAITFDKLANCSVQGEILRYYITDPDGAGPLTIGWNCETPSTFIDTDNQTLSFNNTTGALTILGGNSVVLPTNLGLTGATVTGSGTSQTLNLTRNGAPTISIVLPDQDTLYTAGTGLQLLGNQFSLGNIGTAGTYGSATTTPIITTDAQGRVTAVTNALITPLASSITGTANLTPASSKVTVTGGTGAVLTAASVDVNEANLSLQNIGGSLSTAQQGALSLSNIGGALSTTQQGNILLSNLGGNLSPAQQSALSLSSIGGSLNLATQVGSSVLPIANGGTGATTVSGARTNLGLGSLSTQNANAVSITGGAIDGTPIGAITPSTGSFTTLTSAGSNTFGGTTNFTGPVTFSTLPTLPSGDVIAGTGVSLIGTNTGRLLGTGNLTVAVNEAGLNLQNIGGALSTTQQGTILLSNLGGNLSPAQQSALNLSSIGGSLNAATQLSGAVPLANGGTGATTASGARTNLGLGSLATLSTITSSEITDGTIALADLAANSVDSSKIVDGSITFADLGQNGCTANQVLQQNGTGTAWICNSLPSAPVSSVFGRTGAVVAQTGDYTTTQVTEGTNLYFTDSRARNAVSVAGSPLTYNATTGVFGINQASGSQAGYLSASDFGSFSGKVSSVNGTAGQIISSGGSVISLSLANVGTAGSYGSGTSIPVFTTDAQGRVIAVTNTPITPSASSITGAQNLTPASSKVTVTGGTGATLVATTVDVNEANLSLQNIGGALSTTQQGTILLSNLGGNLSPAQQSALSLGNIGGTVNLATQTSGTLGTTNGGTGLTTVGTAGQVLTSNGTTLSYTAPTVASSNITGTISNAQLANSTIGLTTGTTGTDVNVSGSPASLGGALTLNIPDASATARGLITNGAQTIAGTKSFTGPSFNVGSVGSPITSINLSAANIVNTGDTTFRQTSAALDNIVISPANVGTTGFSGVITNADLTANRTYTLPDSSGTICLSSNNCGFVTGTANNLTTSTTGLSIANGTGATLTNATINYNLQNALQNLSQTGPGTLGGTGTSNAYIGYDGVAHQLPGLPTISSLPGNLSVAQQNNISLANLAGSLNAATQLSGITPTANGGTGLTTVGAAGTVLSSNGTTLSYITPTVTSSNITGTINLASQVSGVLPLANGGTGTALGNGTTGQVLTSNGAGGTSWTTPTAAPLTSIFGRTGVVTAQSGDYTTTQVTEGTNLYFTNGRAIAAPLTGYTSGAGTISGTDSILQAIQKLNGNQAATAALQAADLDGIIGNEVTGATDATLTRSGTGTSGSPYTLAVNQASLSLSSIGGNLSTTQQAALTLSSIGGTLNAASQLSGAVPIANGGTGATTAAAARTNLGLGSLATLSTITSAEITDGTIAAADIANGAITTSKLAACASNGQILKYYATDPDGAGPLVVGWNCDTDSGSIVTPANLTAASSKVAVTGGTGAVLTAATVDVNEANLSLNNIGGTLSLAKGGTGTALGNGTSGQVLTSNGAGGTSWTTAADTNLGNADQTLTGARTVTLGANNLSFSGTGGGFTVNTGGGSIAIGSDTSGQNVNLGSGNGAKFVTVGSSNTISTLELKGGTGNILNTTPQTIFRTAAISTQDQLSITPFAGGANRFTGNITSLDLTADRTYSLPDASGTVCLTTTCGGTVTSVTGTAGQISVATGTTTPVISLANAGTAGTYGTASSIPVFTTDAQGRVTAVTNTAISGLTTSNLSAAAGISNAQLANSTYGTTTGTTGLAPAFSSIATALGGTTQLNIPLASGTGVTSGTISKADYDSFAAKQGALTFSTGLTNTAGTVTVNTSQNFTTLSNLTTAGVVKTTAAGLLSSGLIAGTDIGAGAITGSNIAAGTIDLTTKVTGILPTTNGGTGLATVGTNGQVLTSNGTTLSWTTPTTGTVTSVNAGTGISVTGTAAAPIINNTGLLSIATSTGTTGLTITPTTASGAVTQVLSGTLALANGGTGSTTAAGARTNLGLGSLATLNAITSAEITDGTISLADLNQTACTANQIIKQNATGTGWVCSADAGSIVTPANVTAGSTKVTLGGTPTGAALQAFSVDVNEANLSLQNIGGALSATQQGGITLANTTGTLSTTRGGTGLTTIGAAGTVLSSNGTTLSYITPTVASSNITGTITNAQLANSTYGTTTGTTGLAPAFSAASTALGGTVQLNIPLASGAGVTSGTISKTDYDLFAGKQNAITAQAVTIGTGITLGGTPATAALQPFSISLATTGITAGTYNNLTVDATGRATVGSNVAYLTAETDGVIGNEITNIGATTGLVRSGLGTGVSPYLVDLKACANNEILKFVTPANTWGCSTDAGSIITPANLTAASTKVAVTGGTGAVLTAATVDVNEANLALNNIGGTLGVTKGGTGLTTSTLGGILQGAAGNTYTNLAIGTANQVLTSNGTTASWVTPAAATVTGATNGLTLASGNIGLGGTLSSATTIATSATNTLTLSGLQAGSATDAVITNVGGVLKTTSVSTLLNGNTTNTFGYVPSTGVLTNTTNGVAATATIPQYVGATATVAGTQGLVNPAAATQQNFIYTGGGTWINPNTLSIATSQLTGTINLATQVSGALPLANGGTGTALANGTSGQVITSNGLGGTSWTTPTVGVTALAAVGAVPNANGGSISGNTLTLQPADLTNPGLVTIGTQSFAGLKTFQNNAGTDFKSNIGTGDILTLSANQTGGSAFRGTITSADLTVDQTYTLPNVTGTICLVSTCSGTVTNVAASGGTTGLTFTGSPITTAGTLTLGGTLGVTNGGTGLATSTIGGILVGSSTSAYTNLAIGAAGTTLTSNGTTAAWTAATGWLTTGNAATVAGTNFIGTTDNVDVVMKRNGIERLRIGTATSVPAVPTSGVSTNVFVPLAGAANNQLLFTNSVAGANLTIASSTYDFYWQSGFGNQTQYGAYHGIDISGGRASNAAPAFLTGTGATFNTRILNTSAAQIGLIVNGLTAATSDLQQWQVNGVVLDKFDAAGNLGVGVAGTVNNKVEINQGVAGNSGLRFTQLPNTTAGVAGNGKVLGVNANGDVIYVNDQGAGAVTSLSAAVDPGAPVNANAATITTGVLNLNFANATNSGIVSTTTQTFAGNKTFNNNVNINGNTVIGDAVSDTIITNAANTINGSTQLNCSPITDTQSQAFVANLLDTTTCVNIVKTVSGQTVTLPSPTNTTAGKRLTLLNTGTASFLFQGQVFAPNASFQAIWNGTQWTLTGDGTPAGNGGTFRKTADTTIANSATLTNDPDLKFQVGANETWYYQVSGSIKNAGPITSGPGIRAIVNPPSAATNCSTTISTSYQGGVANSSVCGTPAINRVFNNNTTSAGSDAFVVQGVFTNGSTAGTAFFQWAQGNAQNNVNSATISNGGTGYTTPPTISFTGGACTTAPAATATVTGGLVNSITVNTLGVCTVAPTIVFTGGAGSGAVATLNLGVTILKDASISAYRLSGADLAEIYYTEDGTMVEGQIVSLAGDGQSQVGKSVIANREKAIGIVSTKPGQVIGAADGKGRAIPVALTGRVPVKVTTKNGAIKAGDQITVSDIPGVGQLATTSGRVIGKALTASVGEGEQDIVVFVEPGFWQAPVVFDLSTLFKTEGLNTAPIAANADSIAKEIKDALKLDAASTTSYSGFDQKIVDEIFRGFKLQQDQIKELKAKLDGKTEVQAKEEITKLVGIKLLDTKAFDKLAKLSVLETKEGVSYIEGDKLDYNSITANLVKVAQEQETRLKAIEKGEKVAEDNSGLKLEIDTLKTSFLKDITEIKAKNSEQDGRLQTLETENAALKARLDRIEKALVTK